MRDSLCTLFFAVVLIGACEAPRASDVLGKVTPVMTAAPKTVADVTALIKIAGPALLKTFRTRMDFVEVQPQVTEQGGAFSVIAELQYHSFLKQNRRTARLSFSLSAGGLVTQCRIEDPVKKAAEVSCSQLEAKLAQIFAPAFR